MKKEKKKNIGKNIQEKDCCKVNLENKEDDEKRGFFAGIKYAIIPHIPCCSFILFSILGVTFFADLIKPLLLNTNFFYFLILLSILFASFSAFLYLKNHGLLNLDGVKKKWKYLTLLFSSTIAVNAFFFYFLFPAFTNLQINENNIKANGNDNIDSSLVLKVAIPCPGHARLVINELKVVNGIKNVKYTFPDIFEVTYDKKRVSKKEIMALDLFKDFPAEVIKED